MSRTDSSGQDGLREAVAMRADSLSDGCALKLDLRAILADHPATTTEETAEVADEDREALREAVIAGLRKCRIEDGASVALIRAGDLSHISHMITVEVAEVTANAKAEVDDLRARLAKAEADVLLEVADFIEATSGIGLATSDYADGWYAALGHVLGELRDRAALANPDAAGEGK